MPSFYPTANGAAEVCRVHSDLLREVLSRGTYHPRVSCTSRAVVVCLSLRARESGMRAGRTLQQLVVCTGALLCVGWTLRSPFFILHSLSLSLPPPQHATAPAVSCRPNHVLQCFKDKKKLERVLADPRVYKGKLRLQSGLEMMALSKVRVLLAWGPSCACAQLA
jgi:hypothetical protein